uniref:Uncharacterized protein n=1 Tax=Mola mola TaxID=94237 RepID=A0A3Q3WE27_MOLML
MGLRVKKFPSLCHDNPIVKQKWEETLNKRSLDLILSLIEQSKHQKDALNANIDNIGADISCLPSDEPRLLFENKMKGDIAKLHTSLKRKKFEKLNRDSGDHKKGTSANSSSLDSAVVGSSSQHTRSRSVSFNPPSRDKEDWTNSQVGEPSDFSDKHNDAGKSKGERTRPSTNPQCSHCVLASFKIFSFLMSELSTSIKDLQYDMRASAPNSDSRKWFFDTHAVVRLFEENGFTTQQAEVLVKTLARMTNSNMDIIYNDMVTKVQQEIMLQRVMSQIAAVKKDMIILEKSEFSTLLAENEFSSDILCISLLQDVMNKVRSDTILDMNLEKRLLFYLDLMKHDLHLTQTNMKIDTEVAGLKTMLESHKLDTIKYLAGSVFTCLTVVLSFYRIWM